MIYTYFLYIQYLSEATSMVIFRGQQNIIVSKQYAQTQRFRSLGALFYNTQTGYTGVSTALLISPRIILTAAHNIYNKHYKDQFKNFRFSPSVSGQITKVIKAEQFKYLNEFKICPYQDTRNFDYAVLILKEEVNYSKFMPLCYNFSQEKMLSLYAYNANFSSKDCAILAGEEKKQNGRIQRNLILHTLNSTQGYSGAPLTIQLNDHNRVGAVGIHLGTAINFNYGRLFTQDLIANVLAWAGNREIQRIQILNLKTGKYLTLRQKLQFSQKNAIQKMYLYLKNIEEQYKDVEQSSNQNSQRMGCYINFRINTKFYQYITVNHVRLYYELHNEDKTYIFNDLASQYYRLTDKYLTHSLENDEIDLQMPVNVMIENQSDRQRLQTILNILNNGKKLILYEDKQGEAMEMRTNVSFSQLGLEYLVLANCFLCQITIIFKQQKHFLVRMIDRDQVILNIVKELKQIYHITSQNYEIKGQNFTLQYYDYQKRFSQLNFEEQQIKVIFYNQMCLVGKQTKIKAYKTVSQEFQSYDCEISQLQTADIGQSQNVLSYNHSQKDSGGLTIQKIQNIFKNERVFSFVILKYEYQGESLQIQCSRDTLLRNQTHQWIKVQQIAVGSKVLGIDSKKSEKIVVYTIVDKQECDLDEPNTFYCISVENTHTYVGNNLILHNQNSFEIEVFEKGQKIKNLKVFKYDKIGQAFRSYDVYAGGTKLNPNSNFGDYQLYNLKKVNIYPQGAKKLNLEISQLELQEESLLTVSEWKKDNQNNQLKKIPQIQKNKWRNHYLAIFNNKIIPFQQKFNQLASRQSLQYGLDPQIIVAQKIYLQRNYYLQQMGLYDKYENEAFKSHSNKKDSDKFKQIVQKNSNLDEKDLFPIYLYTAYTQIYTKLNEKLRNQSLFEENEQNKKMLALINTIIRSLRKLPKLKEQTTVYRGVARLSGIMFNEVGKTIIFEGFTSTSKNPKLAKIFASQKGVFFEIQTYSGKLIQEISCFPHEQEVLIPPYTCFLIESYEEREGISIVKLKQIPQPCTPSTNIVFWVDDNPDNNNDLKESLSQDIEVIDVLSTRLMETILQDFFWVYRFLNKKIMIISDMVREEDEKLNLEAGADVFTFMYNELGFSNRGIIYTSDPSSVKKVVRKRNITSKNWSIISSPIDIIDQVNSEFFCL